MSSQPRLPSLRLCHLHTVLATSLLVFGMPMVVYSGNVISWGEQIIGANVYGGRTIKNVAGGAHHALAVANDGTLIPWGLNNYGETVVPTGIGNVVQVAGGWEHTLALKSDGTVASWGNNSFSQNTVPS